jgi:lipopolysaccharide transport system ATP-binding protein
MSDTVIKVENLGKKYILTHQQEGHGKYKALRDVIADGVKSLGSRIKNPKSQIPNNREEFWALQDVSFEIKAGDRVGIIGRNGAGKSTLLKILSRITEPTTGRISIKGRVASLLEVGTGFHPELTGRENIYLNGAILGMSRLEIKRKFDEIVAFAEVEKFLDTPVKKYSSGMYVRLAFAVAAHLEPEILVVDEVLAVGDAQFQKKCLGKMEEVGKEGRTVLFVSHNINVVKALCQKGIQLQKGTIVSIGEVFSVLDNYLSENSIQQYNFLPNIQAKVYFQKIRILGDSDVEQTEFGMGDDIMFEFLLCFNNTLSNLDLGVNIKNAYGEIITHVCNMDAEFYVSGTSGDSILFRVKIPEIKYSPGIYYLDTAIGDGNLLFDKHPDFAQIIVNDSLYVKRTGGFPRHVKVFSTSLWSKIID